MFMRQPGVRERERERREREKVVVLDVLVQVFYA
jgi:hypothetical protein